MESQPGFRAPAGRSGSRRTGIRAAILRASAQECGSHGGMAEVVVQGMKWRELVHTGVINLSPPPFIPGTLGASERMKMASGVGGDFSEEACIFFSCDAFIG